MKNSKGGNKMFYKIAYIEHTNKPIENSSRLYTYMEAENEQVAIETLRGEREFEVDGLKSEIKKSNTSKKSQKKSTKKFMVMKIAIHC